MCARAADPALVDVTDSVPACIRGFQADFRVSIRSCAGDCFPEIGAAIEEEPFSYRFERTVTGGGWRAARAIRHLALASGWTPRRPDAQSLGAALHT